MILAAPNPGISRIRFYLNQERAGQVRVQIFTVGGELAAELSAGAGTGGVLVWDCSGVARGVYLVRLLCDGREVSRMKVALVY